MKPLLASHISVSNFRALPENFELPIPAKPGLVIVYGMNGLGKTTLFEALEWLFTGDVMRLRDRLHATQHDKNLTRRGATEMSHRVSLSFDDPDTSLERTAHDGPSRSEVVRSLSDPNWSPTPLDPKPYMRLTMFLPQTKKYRFDAESGQDKWRMLEEPAGVERLNQMRLALINKATTHAFRRAIDKRRKVTEDAIAAFEQWEQMLKSRDEFLLSPGSADIVPPEAASEMVAKARVKLDKSTKRSLVDDRDSNSTDDIRLVVGESLRDAQSAKQAGDDRLEELTNATKGVTEWQEKTNTLSKLMKKQEDLLEQKSEADAAVEQGVAKTKGILAEVTTSIATSKKAEQQVDDLQNLLASQKNLAEVTLRREHYSGKLEEVSSFLKVAVNLRAAASSQTRAIAELSEEQNAIKTYLERLDVFTATSRAFDQGESVADGNTIMLAGLRKQLIKLQEAIPKIETELVRQRQNLKELETQKVDAIAESDRMSKAIASVCDHIANDATTCPVCLQEYDSAELKRRTELSLRNAGVDTEKLDDAIEELTGAVRSNEKALGDSKTLEIQLPIQIAELTRLADDRAMRRKQFESDADALNIDSSTISESIAARREEAAQRQAEITKQLDQQSDLETSRRVLAVAEFSAKKLEEILELTQGHLDSFALNAQQKQVVVNSLLGKIEQPTDVPPVTVERMLQQALARQVTIESDLELRRTRQEATETENRSLAEKRDSIDLDLDSLGSQIQGLKDRLVILVQRWELLDLSGTPEPGLLADEVATVEDRLRELEKVARDLGRVSRGLEAWYEDTRIATIRQQIQQNQRSLNVKTEAEVTEALKAKIDVSESLADRAERSGQFAQELSAKMLERASEFNQLALKPLENRIQRFNDVLSPFRYRIRLAASSGKSRASLKQMVAGMHFGDTQEETQADAELSDGQISVQSLSTLFAASCAYPWSRWRALLLDDPLQSSDLLHTSSFLDILRGLILKQGYQVILSSHDMEEAKYIIRKCKQSGVAVTGCHLLGPTARGVRYEVS